MSNESAYSRWQKLSSLSPDRRRILTLRGQNKTNREIGEIMQMTEANIKYHMGEIYKKLGIKTTGKDIPKPEDELFPYFDLVARMNRGDSPPEEESSSGIGKKSTGASSSEASPPPPPPPIRDRRFIPSLILNVLMAILLCTGLFLFVSRCDPRPIPPPITQVAPTAYVTQVVTEVITQVVTQNVTRSVNETRVVTQNVTQAVTQVVTQIVTVIAPTPVPTETITPVPTPVMSLPYVADFSAGIPKEFGWTSEQAAGVDGKLSMRADTSLLIGDPEWEDYQLTVQVNNMSGAGGFAWFEMGVRAKMGNYVGLRYEALSGWNWVEMKDGKWDFITSGRAQLDSKQPLIIIAKGNRFQSNDGREIILDGHEKGMVHLQLQRGQELVSLKIEPLP